MTAAHRKPQSGRVRVGVLGAGAWAEFAHIPGYKRDPRCELVAIADPVVERANAFAEKFGIPHVYDSHAALIARDDIDLVDVCTPSATHFELSWAALEASKHVLCEKPVAYDYRDTLRAAALAKQQGVKTKLGFTFRYSPAMQYMKQLIDEGSSARRSSSMATSRTHSGSTRRIRCARWITTRISRSSRCRRSRATARRSWISGTCSWGAASVR